MISSAMPTPPRASAFGTAERDQDAARERNRAAGEQPAWEALLQEDSGQDRDQDRAGVDQHRGGAGVDPALCRIQGDAVDPE
jgi:hypothetical protein